jgi:outer membrane protein assembly factor BamB
VILGACPEARQADVSAERRRETILRSWRDKTPEAAPLLPADAAWTRALPAAAAAAGAMDDQRVFVPLRDTTFVALNRETGATVWTRAIQAVTGPTVGDGQVYVATAEAVHSLDSGSGQDRWSTALASVVTAPLVLDTGWLIAMTRSGDVVAFRAADGAIMWRRSVGAGSAHPVVSSGDGALYVSLSDSRLVALVLDTGEIAWEQRLTGTISEPASARDRVFVGSTDNFLYAFHRNGQFEWKWRNGGDVIGVATEGDVVYVASLDNIIRAVNRGNGNQRWKKSTVTRPTFPPLTIGGTVVLTGNKPAVTTFVGATGEAQGTLAAGGEPIGPPLIDTELKPFRVALVTITRDGLVEALRPRGMTFRETAPAPLRALPGRTLARDRLQ